jgi:ribosome biogenesis GTPase
MQHGLVMRSTGSRYLVRGEDGTFHVCVAKGNLRIKGWKSTNPLAVGDRVEFEPAAEMIGTGVVGTISGLRERTNYLVRRSVNLSHHKHVIAANLDQLLLMATVARPRTSYGFIDRMLVTAEAYRVPAILIFNKVDDCTEADLDRLAEYQDTYETAGYRTVITSAVKGIGIDELRSIIAGKVSLVAGHSGVGKSTLINVIQPDLELPTFEVSEASQKGQHTTTYAEMFELKIAEGAAPTFLIDTPGIKGFGRVDMSVDEIVDQFPEMFRLKNKCRFNDCKHINEPGCAVKAAVENGDIAESRYNSYIDMVNGVEEESPYRLD